MSTLIGQLFLALLLLSAGTTAWRFAAIERAAASAHERLATLVPGAATMYEDIDAAMTYVRRVPRVGDTLLADVRAHRSIANYWDANYAAVSVPNDTNGVPVARDPEQLFVAANAAYRSAQRQNLDPLVAAQRLDQIVKSYALVLDRRPEHADAAWNYEFVVRQRNLIAKTHVRLNAGSSERVKGAFPSGPTIHGQPGAPPRDRNMGRFEFLIPVEGESDVDQPPEETVPRKRGRG